MQQQRSNFRSPKLLNLLFCILVSLLSTGCQLTEKSTDKTAQKEAHHSHYYLWLKSLSHEELLAEIKQQQQSSTHSNNSDINLALLYALPSSPIFNPYTAKTKLNELGEAVENDLAESSADLGFIIMLKDQLNQQLLALNKLALTKQRVHVHKSLLQQEGSIKKAQASQISVLQQQIEQLKTIENNINNQE